MARAIFVLLLVLSLSAVASAQFACAGFEMSDPVGTGVAAKQASSMREQGGVHALVIFAKFAGETPQIRRAPDYAAKLLDPNLPGSLAHFYDTMSFDQFRLRGTVLSKRRRRWIL